MLLQWTSYVACTVRSFSFFLCLLLWFFLVWIWGGVGCQWFLVWRISKIWNSISIFSLACTTFQDYRTVWCIAVFLLRFSAWFRSFPSSAHHTSFFSFKSRSTFKLILPRTCESSHPWPSGSPKSFFSTFSTYLFLPLVCYYGQLCHHMFQLPWTNWLRGFWLWPEAWRCWPYCFTFWVRWVFPFLFRTLWRRFCISLAC